LIPDAINIFFKVFNILAILVKDNTIGISSTDRLFIIAISTVGIAALHSGT
jgi:hypothetical protein